MNRNNLLALIAIVLVGIFSVIVYNSYDRKTPNTLGDSINNAARDAGEKIEELGDDVKEKMDDNTKR